MKQHQPNDTVLKDWNEPGLWEYTLRANPDKKVHDKVLEEKKTFHSEYKTELAINNEPRITIANFLAKEMMEETLCRWTQKICNHQQSFTVALNNFSGFPAHAIYIRVQNPEPFTQLANGLKSLENFIKSNECPPLQMVTKPHMTIARQLPEDIYNKAIKEYAQRSFHEVFTLDKLILLKRDNRYKKWEHVSFFPLPERNLFN